MSHAGPTRLKAVIIGDSGVGKTSLLRRFDQKPFKEDPGTTIGLNLTTRQLVLNGETIQVVFWDTAGQERFRTMTRSFYRNSDLVIIVFDVASRSSFESVDQWLDEMRRSAEPVYTVLIGNKIDLPDRQVSTEEARQFAQERSLVYLETSARTVVTLDDCLMELVETCLSRQRAKAAGDEDSGEQAESQSESVSVDAEAESGGNSGYYSGCCT